MRNSVTSSEPGITSEPTATASDPPQNVTDALLASRMKGIERVTIPAAVNNPSQKYRAWFRDTVLKEFDTAADAIEYVQAQHISLIVTGPSRPPD